MPIVLSQRISIQSDYDDIPFVEYHYPKRYSRQISSGDKFIYYQGDRFKRRNRFYFGCGVVGRILRHNDGESFVATILSSCSFPNSVPIHKPDGSFYESIDFGSVRQKELPPWQSSIRPISQQAFDAIINDSKLASLEVFSIAPIEQSSDLESLKRLNDVYKILAPEKRAKAISTYLDRGSAVTIALKKILGSNCQICNWHGFLNQKGDRYIEAHHITQVADGGIGALCSDNIILVCPNCHRELHHGSSVSVATQGEFLIVTTEMNRATIRKNTIEYLQSLSSKLGV